MAVKEVCHRSGKQLYWYCIAFYNTGTLVENGDLRSLSTYARDFAENNATITLDHINQTLIPGQPELYIQEVLFVCRDSFARLEDGLVNQVKPMIVDSREFHEAKIWVNYGMGLVDSCRTVCNHVDPHYICPLKEYIRDTEGCLKLLASALDLLTEGFT